MIYMKQDCLFTLIACRVCIFNVGKDLEKTSSGGQESDDLSCTVFTSAGGCHIVLLLICVILNSTHLFHTPK